jgi:hypothetical protein
MRDVPGVDNDMEDRLNPGIRIGDELGKVDGLN